MYFKFSFCKESIFIGFTSPASPAQLVGHDSVYSFYYISYEIHILGDKH